MHLSPWARNQNKRLKQYLETEQHEWMDAIEQHRAERDGKEQVIDLELSREGREGSNWLENREKRMSDIVLTYQRTIIAARIDIRKRLGLECAQLLSDAELSKLEEAMLCSLQVAWQVRRDDYQRRAHAAGVPISRPEQRDAAAYGDLEAWVRREVRKLSLARSLGRIQKPSRLKSIFKPWPELEPVMKLLTAILLLAAAAIGLYLKLR